MLAQLEPYASRGVDETDFDTFLIGLFSLIVPYCVWAFLQGLGRVQSELRALRPVLNLDDAELEDQRALDFLLP